MAVKNGTDLTIYVDGVAVGHAKNASISMNDALIDVTTKGSGGWEESLHGLRSFAISGDSLMDLTDSEGAVEFTAMITARETATVRFTTNTSGEEYWTGTILAESVDISAPTEDAVGYSYSFKGTGALTNPQLT